MKRLEIKNKKKFLLGVSIIVIFIVVTIAILVNVIIQNKENSISKVYEESNKKSTKSKMVDINKYTQQENVNETIQRNYLEEIQSVLLVDNIDSLYSKMNKEFLKRNNLNENNFKDYVLKNGYVGKFPACTSMRYSVQRDGSYVCRLNCYRDDRTKFYVNLIENKPFDYTLDFSQDVVPTQDDTYYVIYDTDYNLKFEINELKRTEKSISYELKVINSGDKEIEFYLNNITDMSLEIESDNDSKIDGYVKQASSELSSRKYIINKDSYFIKKLYFPLDMQYHSKVKGMIFYNVRVEDVNQDISITF